MAIESNGFGTSRKPYIPQKTLVRGERFPLDTYKNEPLQLQFTFAGNQEIDGYAFLLTPERKVRYDEDLIFFGNTSDSMNAVINDGCQFTITLRKINPDIETICIVYAIYTQNCRQTFANVQNAQLMVKFQGKNICSFPLEKLPDVTALVAVELYRYKGQWKLKAIGQGYQDTLRSLCERFGVEVA